MVEEFERERDWEQFHSPKNLAMGIAIETGELLEHFQWIDEGQSRGAREDAELMSGIRDEAADVLSYLLLLAKALDFDLSEAFYDKMKRNERKYPAQEYRGKYKLD